MFAEHSLGVGLLNHGSPELVLVVRVHVDEAAVDGRQTIVHQHLDPATVLPEVEAEHACSEKSTEMKLICQENDVIRGAPA